MSPSCYMEEFLKTMHVQFELLWEVTMHPTAGLLLKLSRVGPGQSLDGRPDAA